MGRLVFFGGDLLNFLELVEADEAVGDKLIEPIVSHERALSGLVLRRKLTGFPELGRGSRFNRRGPEVDCHRVSCGCQSELELRPPGIEVYPFPTVPEFGIA